MKALTLHQPWATLIAIGAKRIETRSWETKYRGLIAIHAAAAFPKYARRMLCHPVCRTIDVLPLGAVVATARLVTVLSTELFYRDGNVVWYHGRAITEQELAFGDYSPGRFAWVLEDVKPLPEPIPAKGGRRIWNWSEA
jgi:hypothetical protein